MKRLYRRISIFVKKLMPKQILWRTFFILVSPIIILQIVIGTVFYRQYINDEIHASVNRTIAHIEFIKDQELTTSEYKDFLLHFSKYQSGYFKLLKQENKITNDCAVNGIMLLVKRQFAELNFPLEICRIKNNKKYRLYIPFNQEYYLRITHSPRYFFSSQWHFLPAWSISASLLLIFIAFIFLKNQMRPIVRLGNAAEAFGKGNSNYPLHSSGAIEIRQAGTAFIEMRKKITNFINNRSLLLAGISHDLRTLLTRLSLELSMMEKSDEVTAMKSDVKRMENILQSYIDFVSGNNTEYMHINAENVIATLISRFSNEDTQVDFSYDGHHNIILKDQSLERIVINLLSNALKYGQKIKIHASFDNQKFHFSIEDNGIGVPQDQYENIFEPFYTAKTERTQTNNSGSGLGLALVKDIVTSHGGTIYAEKSQHLGGLKISLMLSCPTELI